MSLNQQKGSERRKKYFQVTFPQKLLLAPSLCGPPLGLGWGQSREEDQKGGRLMGGSLEQGGTGSLALPPEVLC